MLRTPSSALAALALCASAASAVPFGYAIDRTHLYRIDLATAQATPIGDTGIGHAGLTWWQSLATDAEGRLFGTNTEGNLYSLDRSTGQATLIGDTDLLFPSGLDFTDDGSTLLVTDWQFATGVYGLSVIDATPTFRVTASPFGAGRFVSAAVRGDSLFVLTRWATGFDHFVFYHYALESVDLATGATTTIRQDMQRDVGALDFAADGRLYALSSAGDLVILDPDTGAESVVGNAGVSPWLGFAASPGIPVPEPSTLVLLGFGVAGIALRQLRGCPASRRRARRPASRRARGS